MKCEHPQRFRPASEHPDYGVEVLVSVRQHGSRFWVLGICIGGTWYASPPAVRSGSLMFPAIVEGDIEGWLPLPEGVLPPEVQA